MSGKLRVAVVGLTIGAGHASNYAASDSVEEIMLCDTDEGRLKEVGDRLSITRRYTDYEQMLRKGKPDAVSVAVPNFLHLPFTLKALEAGAHVLCEKPMARNAGEAEQMLEAAQRHSKKLMVNFNQRYQKENLALKGVIDSGKLGEIYFAQAVWQRRRGVPWWYPLENGWEACGGGALIDLGVHVLDKAMWLCGYPHPEWVLGNTYNKVSQEEAVRRGIARFELEDMGVAMFRMENGMMLELEASWAANREDESVITRLYGTRGGAVLHTVVRGTEPPVNRLFLERNGELEDFVLDDFMPDELRDGKGYNIRQAFLDCILNDTPPPCTPEQGLMINRMLDVVYESAEAGRPVAYR